MGDSTGRLRQCRTRPCQDKSAGRTEKVASPHFAPRGFHIMVAIRTGVRKGGNGRRAERKTAGIFSIPLIKSIFHGATED